MVIRVQIIRVTHGAFGAIDGERVGINERLSIHDTERRSDGDGEATMVEGVGEECGGNN